MEYLMPIVFALLNFFLNLYIFILLLRFLLEKHGPTQHNRIVRFIARITEPPLIVLRQVIPRYQGFDLAILAFAFLIEFFELFLLIRLKFHIYPGILGTIIIALGRLGIKLVNIYLYLSLIYAVISWLPSLKHNAFTQIVYMIIEPPLTILRRHVPLIAGLDFSILVLIIIVMAINLLVFDKVIQLGMRLAF